MRVWSHAEIDTFFTNRQFTADRPNALWVADFTYVSTGQGFVYVAFVIDVFARYLVGWKVSRSARIDFVLDAGAGPVRAKAVRLGRLDPS